MDLKDEAVQKMVDVAARVLKPKAQEQAPQAANTSIRGSGNVIGSGNVVVVVEASAANDAPLGADRKAALDHLVDELVFHESMKRGKPYRANSVWLQLRKGLDLPPKLRDVDFDRMERYLRGWLARAAAAEAAPGHDEKWRKRRVARILSTCKELDRHKLLEQLLAARYGAAILIELGDDQLNEVFQLVSTWA